MHHYVKTQILDMWWHTFLFMFLLIISIILNVNFVQSQEEEAQSELLINFIFGIGIPTHVEGGFMTTGYAIRVKYIVPLKLSHWKAPFAQYFKERRSVPRKRKMKGFSANINNNEGSEIGKKRRKKINSNIHKYRWLAYKGLEAYGNRLGYKGRACVLRSICEASIIPFNWNMGLLGELMQILLTPSTSTDTLIKHSDNEYFHAEYLGKSGAPCDRIFRDCTQSLLKEFSIVYLENI